MLFRSAIVGPFFPPLQLAPNPLDLWAQTFTLPLVLNPKTGANVILSQLAGQRQKKASLVLKCRINQPPTNKPVAEETRERQNRVPRLHHPLPKRTAAAAKPTSSESHTSRIQTKAGWPKPTRQRKQNAGSPAESRESSKQPAKITQSNISAHQLAQKSPSHPGHHFHIVHIAHILDLLPD